MEGQNQGQGIKGISDRSDIGIRSWWRMDKLLIGKMIFAELVMEFKLRRFDFLKYSFAEVKILFLWKIDGAVVIIAFIDGTISILFPKEKSIAAVRAKVFCYRTMPLMHGRHWVAYFTFKLRAFFAIIEIEIVMRGSTGVTERIFWDGILRISYGNKF